MKEQMNKALYVAGAAVGRIVAAALVLAEGSPFEDGIRDGLFGEAEKERLAAEGPTPVAPDSPLGTLLSQMMARRAEVPKAVREQQAICECPECVARRETLAKTAN